MNTAVAMIDRLIDEVENLRDEFAVDRDEKEIADAVNDLERIQAITAEMRKRLVGNVPSVPIVRLRNTKTE